jgi:hypothetical protein
MKSFFESVILISLPLLILSCSGGYEQPQKLHRNPQITLEISLNKDEYVEGEPIWLTAKFKNVGNKVDSLADFDDDYVIYHNLKIDSDSSLPVRYYGVIEDKAFPVYTKLKPGEVYDISVDVRQFWMNKYLGVNLFSGYILEGKYSVRSFYISAWSEDWIELISNEIPFRVVKPSKITSEAFDSLIDIFKPNIDWAKQLNRYYVMHPKSVYAEEAFYYYTVMRILDNNKNKIDSTFLNECYDFFENYPCSYYKCEVLKRSEWAYRIIKGRNQKNFLSYLECMKSKYPDLTGCADKIIERDKNTRNTMIWEKRKQEGFNLDR